MRIEDYEEQFQYHRIIPLVKVAEDMENQPEREVETELRNAIDNPESVAILMSQEDKEANVNLQAEFRRLMREYECDRREAAMHYFQKIYNSAVECKSEMAEGEFYKEKYGRLPETREEVINWWLEYDAAHTTPISGGVRHNITIQEQADQLMAMSDYPAGMMSKVRCLYSDEKYDQVINLLTDYDVHNRITDLVPIADKIRANKKHKVNRIISDAERDLERLNDC